MDQHYRVRLSPEAALDINAIHAFVSNDSPDNATKLVERILSAIESLGMVPHRTVLQRRGKGLAQPVRTLPVKPYVIYFRVFRRSEGR